ncbi:hypothetical protein CISIN_1g036742mg [Citrus sinensis]|uniref:Replication factor C C-terminal domain-containing protein n=1 Tax=Citrus sinensis TaxID=2711 RepID=A0A067FXS2_CITSI|nr:hypothetical protein CISIN_1g036742mg [Citrus sinensis]
MESSSRYSRASTLHSHSSAPMKQNKSGYEPSDTETDWQESPWHDHNAKNGGDLADDSNLPRNISTSLSTSSVRHALKIDKDDRFGSPPKFSSPARRRQSSKLSEKPNYNRRAMTAPKLRPVLRDKEQENNHAIVGQKERITSASSLPRNPIRRQREVVSKFEAPTIGELNEMVASAKMFQGPITTTNAALRFESTDSIGDIFFSRDGFAKNGGVQADVHPRPVIFPQRNSSSHHESRSNSGLGIDQTPQRPSLPIPPITPANLVVSRQSSNGKFSSEGSKTSYASVKSSTSSTKFANNRRKTGQADAWFSCMKKGSCRKSKSSPEKRAFDETSFIQKAVVIEKLRPFWADKHQPSSLNGFICHRHEAQLLKELVVDGNCPHILIKGQSGSGKRALAMALLHEIYGDACWNEKWPTQVLVPVASSAHHVELNVNLQANAKYALMGLVKEIRDNLAITPEVSNAMIVIYEVDKAAEHIQYLIKWIMDGYTDSCKLILCCEDDVDIIESVKTHCKVIKVDPPVTHEIMEVLIQIARKEDFDLSMTFAAKIATKAKQNLRKAIMALEACKALNYPFADDQPIPLGWEEVLIELAAEILADPSPKRLVMVRGKIQKLLAEFVHPKLILLVMHYI